MLLMGILIHLYTVTPMQVGVDFKKIGLDLSLSDVVMSWPRPHRPMKCIPYPYWMYTKCFSTLICYEWTNKSTLKLLCLSRLGVDFRKIGVDLSLSNVSMSWLRLKPSLECIPHPNWMYTKCFSTLICYEWAYKSTLTLVCLCRFGVDFRKIGFDLSLSDVIMSWLRLKPPCEMHSTSIWYV